MTYQHALQYTGHSGSKNNTWILPLRFKQLVEKFFWKFLISNVFKCVPPTKEQYKYLLFIRTVPRVEQNILKTTVYFHKFSIGLDLNLAGQLWPMGPFVWYPKTKNRQNQRDLMYLVVGCGFNVSRWSMQTTVRNKMGTACDFIWWYTQQTDETPVVSVTLIYTKLSPSSEFTCQEHNISIAFTKLCSHARVL